MSDPDFEKWLKKSLQIPSDFGYRGKHPIGETWSLGPVILNRDSGLLEQANSITLRKMLKEDGFRKGTDYDIESASHWAVGWVEHLLFRAIDKRGKPTKVAKFIYDTFTTMAEAYPVLDDSLYSELQYKATLENIKNEGDRLVADNAPKSWPGEVFGWLWDNNQSAVEDRDDQGGYPSESQITEALKALGYYYDDED